MTQYLTKCFIGKSGTDGTFSDILSAMARLSRIVIVNVPHHVTQRGNARQFLLTSDAERLVYLNLAGGVSFVPLLASSRARRAGTLHTRVR